MAKKKDYEMTEVETNLPAAMQEEKKGFEDGLDQDDLIIPRAKLLQPLSPEVQDDNLDVKAGQIINSLTKEVLPVKFTPIFVYKEFLRFNPRNKNDDNFDDAYEPGALMWRTRDANDPRVLAECGFGANGEKPAALTALNFFAVFEDQPIPIIISFTKTSYKNGKKLLSLCRFSKGDMFNNKYQLLAKRESNDAGDYYILDVNVAGECTPTEATLAEGYWKQYSARRENVQAHVVDEAL